jgi:hypothetical protein
MNFKDQLQADLNTFLSQDEFADEHDIDGLPVMAVVDSSVQQEHPLSYAEGVFLSRITLFVARVILGYVPEEDQRMRVDGKRYRVDHVSEEDGMLVLRLEANDT